MSVGEKNSSTPGEAYTPALAARSMRQYPRRASPTTLSGAQQQNTGVLEKLDKRDQDPCSPITITTEITISPPYAPTVVIPQTVTYTPSCSPSVIPNGTETQPFTNQASDSLSSDLPASTLREPFYASTIPMAYSIAMTITLSYILLFLLFLSTPRPWLQKVATLTVVICLTLALAETTKILALEYSLMGETWTADTESGSARKIREKVVAGIEMRVGRIISDAFLWLAQVQTLIRLFPRHREKIVIKWAGFALIVLDTIFSTLVHFLSPTTFMSAESFLDAIPALSYLFEIALSLLYASCVVYYSLSSRIRRFAYYHPKAPSNILLAILSLAAVLIPMIFFCLDISQRNLAAWGDYVRWVGAAAASVVVWEWVDRIERLEREERREGVLGREILDGDDGLVEDMGISQDDDGRGNAPDKGSDNSSSQAHSRDSGPRNGDDATRGVTVSGASPYHLVSTSTTHRRGSVTSYQNREAMGSVPREPSVISSAYPNRGNTTGDPTLPTQQPRTTSVSQPTHTEDGFDTDNRPSDIGFVPLRTKDQATDPSHPEPSSAGHIMNGTTDCLGNTQSHLIREGDDMNVITPPQRTPGSEAQSRDNHIMQKNWLQRVNDSFKRQHPTSINPKETKSNRSKWMPFMSNMSFSFPRIKTSSTSSLIIESNSKRVTRDVAGARRQPLPITIIPAPPRGRGISLRELEEARLSGVCDENVRGVGVWTGNSVHSCGLFSRPGNASPEEQQQQQSSSTPAYHDTGDQPLPESLHQLHRTSQQYPDTSQLSQQLQENHTSSFQSSLPPLPPSPPATATTSSWGESQYPSSTQAQSTCMQDATVLPYSPSLPNPTTSGCTGVPLASPSSPPPVNPDLSSRTGPPPSTEASPPIVVAKQSSLPKGLV